MTPLRAFKIIFLVAGLVLLALLIREIDLAESASLIGQIGAGFLIILLLYFLAFLVDSITWQLTVPTLKVDLPWTARFFVIRLAGEAFNNILPAASLGGEPVKAVLLNRLHAIPYREAIASLILAKTINTVSLVVFLAAGFLLMLYSDRLGGAYNSVAGIGLAVFGGAIALLFLVQRYRVATRTSALVSRHSWFAWLNPVLHHIEDMDERLVRFYTGHTGRCLVAFLLALLNWVLGVGEIYVTMQLLGHPVSLMDAWIIEAVAQLVRAGTFFIPASIGAQEGAFLVMGSLITGSPAVGFATAIVRRLREVIWIVWGLAVFYFLKPKQR